MKQMEAESIDAWRDRGLVVCRRWSRTTVVWRTELSWWLCPTYAWVRRCSSTVLASSRSTPRSCLTGVYSVLYRLDWAAESVWIGLICDHWQHLRTFLFLLDRHVSLFWRVKRSCVVTLIRMWSRLTQLVFTQRRMTGRGRWPSTPWSTMTPLRMLILLEHWRRSLTVQTGWRILTSTHSLWNSNVR